MFINHEYFMQKALELANVSFLEGEVPIGAVIVKNNRIISMGRNKRELDKNALLHAEIIAIDGACKALGGWRLPGCTLYVTLEPCPMCAGAIINSRIEQVVFGAFDKKSGAVSSVINLFDFPFNHNPLITTNILSPLCSKILSDFFKFIRLNNNN